MRFKPTYKVNIHFGGTMQKTDDGSYIYVGEIGFKQKILKRNELGWENFEAIMLEEKIQSSIALIWYKLPEEGMRDLKYVFDTSNDAMVDLQKAGKDSASDEIDVFLEHDISAQSPKPVGLISSSQHEDERGYEDRDAECDGGYEPEREGDSDDDLDRPREDDEGEQSEDEEHVADDEVVQENLNTNQNEDGEDVVLDAGDGGNDVRFKSVFEEGARTAADFMASKIRDTEKNGEQDKEAAESEEEDRLGDVNYPDTPVESEEEWEEWTPLSIHGSSFRGHKQQSL